MQTIGIRPGEKLHEVMITEDDARMTVELDDRYVICPSNRRLERRPSRGSLAPGPSRRASGIRPTAIRNGSTSQGLAFTDARARRHERTRFLPYGRQTIGDDDVAAVVAALKTIF